MALLPVTRQRERGGVRTGESERGGEKHCGLQGGGGAGRRRESSDRGALDARTLGRSLALSPRSLPSLSRPAALSRPASLSRSPFSLSRAPFHAPAPLSLSCSLLFPLTPSQAALSSPCSRTTPNGSLTVPREAPCRSALTGSD